MGTHLENNIGETLRHTNLETNIEESFSCTNVENNIPEITRKKIIIIIVSLQRSQLQYSSHQPVRQEKRRDNPSRKMTEWR